MARKPTCSQDQAALGYCILWLPLRRGKSLAKRGLFDLPVPGSMGIGMSMLQLRNNGRQARAERSSCDGSIELDYAIHSSCNDICTSSRCD